MQSWSYKEVDFVVHLVFFPDFTEPFSPTIYLALSNPNILADIHDLWIYSETENWLYQDRGWG